MMRLLALISSVFVSGVCLIVLLVVIVLAPLGTVLSGLAGLGGGGPLTGTSANGKEIAAAAQLLEDHVSGPWSNEYQLANDPIMQSVYQFWVASCGSNGVICPEAVSGNLQCVEFVTGAFFLSGMRLPYVGDAITFWSGYAHLPGWERVPVADGYPQPGDMVIWQGGPYGHIAIVLQVVLPTATQSGWLTVAQGNGMGNRWTPAHQDDSGNWYTMPLRQDGTLETWNGYTVLGYIRQVAS